MSTVVTAAREAISYFLSDADNAEIIRHIESRLGISKKYIENSYCRYAMDSLTSSNEIYNDVGIHVAMWIEYQAQNGLHEKRQFVVLNELERWQPKTIADVGFGGPTKYLRDYVLSRSLTTATLFEKYQAALDVGRTVMDYWSSQYAKKVQFELHDMDQDPPIEGFDCYLMLDSIEHTSNPTRYLAETVAAAHEDAIFLFHIPIGPLIASHSIAWANQCDAKNWLVATGLLVGHTEIILPNISVDHFSSGAVTLENLFVVAHKR